MENAVVSRAVQGILTRGIGTMPSPVAHFVDPIMAHFMHMIEQADRYLEGDLWTIDRKGHGDPDTGLLDRRGQTTKSGYDDKLFFHVDGDDLLELLRKRGAQITEADEHFLMWCSAVRSLLIETAHTVAHTLAREAPELELDAERFFPGDPNQTAVLRLLAYTAVRPDAAGIIAREHKDRGGITLAAAESSPGLETEGADGIFQPVSPEKGSMLVFPGGKMETITDGRLKGTWHRVRKNDARFSPTVIRWSMVFFYHPAGEIAFPPNHR